MWELDYKESWAPKSWYFWTVVLEKTLESPLDCKEIQPVHPKGAQSWVFFGKTDAKAEIPIFWPLHAKCWLIGKHLDAGRYWGQEEKGMAEDEIAGWHHLLDGHEFEWTPGIGDGHGCLACYNSWGRRVGHGWGLNWTELNLESSVPSHTFFQSIWRNRKSLICHLEPQNQEAEPIKFWIAWIFYHLRKSSS